MVTRLTRTVESERLPICRTSKFQHPGTGEWYVSINHDTWPIDKALPEGWQWLDVWKKGEDSVTWSLTVNNEQPISHV